MLEEIKHNEDINTVEQLASGFHCSVRTLQRSFQQYVGLSPKWLIRKYRLHQALTLLEDNEVTTTDLAARLEYTDQSHFIRDFKDMLGLTPHNYMRA